MAGHPAPPLPWTACRVPAEQHCIDQGFCKHRSMEKHWLRSLPKTSSLPEKSIACRCHLAWGTRYIFILGCVWGPEYLLISQTEKHCFLVKGKLLCLQAETELFCPWIKSANSFWQCHISFAKQMLAVWAQMAHVLYLTPYQRMNTWGRARDKLLISPVTHSQTPEDF